MYVHVPVNRCTALSIRGIKILSLLSSTLPSPFPGCTSTYGLLSLKLVLTGLWSGIMGGVPTAVRMCPPLTTKNWAYYTPLLAVGTSGGSIFVINLSTRALVKEFAVHSCRV